MTIGWVRDSGSQLMATHISKGYVGYYNKGTDMTFDSSGRIFCYGDGTCCLIREADK